jgi:hypothetical protein
MEIEIELFKDGDHMGTKAIWHGAENHADGFGGDIYSPADMLDVFESNYAQLLGALIDSGDYLGDWEFQLNYWLPQYTAIIAKLRASTLVNLKFYSGSLFLSEGSLNGFCVASIENGNVHINMTGEPILKLVPFEEYEQQIKDLKNKLLQRSTRIIELESSLARRDK